LLEGKESYFKSSLLPLLEKQKLFKAKKAGDYEWLKDYL
jgi:hypothetical protein